MQRTVPGIVALVWLGSFGCAGAGEDTTPELGAAVSALGPDATVADAIDSECSTASIRALGQQLIDEVQCARPGTFGRIDDIDHVVLGAAAFPWLQTAAANALRVVAAKRESTMTINSSYRTVAQQLMLYSWYRDGQRCGIALAAKPGKSNHESALAVDVDENAAWRATFQANDFSWLGSSDPVHFDYAGDGDTVDLRDLSVAAFQRLWNRNHPEDPIEEDGDYGTATETRILRSPAAGFAAGAPCLESPRADGGIVPAPVDAGSPVADASVAPVVTTAPDFDESGCNMHGSPGGAPWWLVLVLVLRRATGRGTPASWR